MIRFILCFVFSAMTLVVYNNVSEDFHYLVAYLGGCISMMILLLLGDAKRYFIKKRRVEL